MKKLIVVVVILVVVAGYFVYDLLKDAGEFKDIAPHFAGSMEKVAGVVGAEDITIHPQTGVAFISAVDRRALLRGQHATGAIYHYDLQGENPELLNLTSNFEQEFHPHGISLYPGDDGTERLFVVNHRSAGHFIEIFEVADSALIHLESIQDPLMHSPNDVLAVGPRSFYVTNDHGNTSDFGKTLEDYLRLRRAHVLYFDGQNFRRVTNGLLYANGINKSPDGSTIYVAATTAGKVHVYSRDLSTGDLTETAQIDVRTGVDNIEVDAAGNLWLGAHPKLLTFVKYSKDSTKLSPSQVLKITPTSGDYQVEEILLDDGKNLSGSSVAAVFGQKLLIGSVFDRGFLICEMPGVTAK